MSYRRGSGLGLGSPGFRFGPSLARSAPSPDYAGFCTQVYKMKQLDRKRIDVSECFASARDLAHSFLMNFTKAFTFNFSVKIR